jgi:catechol 2,3-dioxygenase-like lactoylglutathione lyase family enzyme
MGFSPRGLTPLLAVFDMPRALHFYRDLLGFEVVFASPEVETREGRFSHWLWLRRGGAELMLNTRFDSDERPEAELPGRAQAHGDTVLYVACDDVDAAHAELVARGLQAPLPDRAPYGLRAFEARDPDGYAIVFQELA